MATSGNARVLRWRWLVPVAALVVAFHFSPFGVALDRAFFDVASRRPLRTHPIPPGSAMVFVDEATMSALGGQEHARRWPFGRDDFAGLIAALDRAGARKIVLDFTFFERSSDGEKDELLASLAAAMPSVTLARTERRAPVFWDAAFQKEHAAYFRQPRAGDVTLQADDDGVARSYSAAGSLAALAFDSPATLAGGLLRWHGGLRTLPQRGDVPVISAAPFFIHGFAIIRRINAAAPDMQPAELAQALAKEPPLTDQPHFAAVRGRTVFVGAIASGTYDVKATPVGKIEPGLLIHWTAWANLAAGGFITPLSRWLALGIAAVGMMAIVGMYVLRHGVAAPGGVTIAFVLVLLAAAYGGMSAGWFLPPATPAVAAILTLLGVAAESFWVEQRRKREIQTMFGSYVDPHVVALLIRDPNAIRLGGDRVPATVYFSDLAGFTDLSEKIRPEELLEIINLYLQEMSDCLIGYGAYIDKYIGDAVMAVFGAPLPNPEHALAACRGALAARRVLASINERLARTHGHTLGMRIGINTGEMIVGNMGSERKRNYTVLGDAVNLASRLEAANKEFGTDILLGDKTARAVANTLATRPLTRLRVKGKLEAVEVHELIGAPADLTLAQRTFLDAYRDAYARYAARDFAAAAGLFARALPHAPTDQVTAELLRRAQEYAQTPPAPDWQPILTLETK